jgi:protoheme IX farnesyltransferase
LKTKRPAPDTEFDQRSPSMDRSSKAEGSLQSPIQAQIESFDSSDPLRHRVPKFVNFAWFVLAYNLLAVAWGVFVRASKSGDGGGASWPLLDTNHMPMNGIAARIIEGSHRVSTGLCGVFALVLLIMAFRSFAKGHQARLFATIAFGLTCLEGAIGAALVKFGLVTTNDSAARLGVMSFHVISTFLLMSAISMAAMSAMGSGRIVLKRQGAVGGMLALGVVGMIFLGVSGALSALAHTLRPVSNVLVEASQPDAFWMVKLQPMHPYLSIAVGIYLCLMAGMVMHLRPSDGVRRAFQVMLLAFCFQSGIGLISIRLEAPIWLQMLHLASGDILFVSLIVALAYALLDTAPKRDAESGDPAGHDWRSVMKAYVAMTKPRVISLLLVTAGMAMIAAAKGWPGLGPFLAVMVGGYFSAGAANSMNMIVDRDIDGRMVRTAQRPTVTSFISTPAAANYSLLLTIGSFAVLWAGANLWAAMIALAGQAFYVCVYTLYLKRRTWQNIVIGGAAGSVPPMVGWVAVTGHLTAMAWWMFALIFIWTPVHFWALALLLKDDYAQAGVPMLPVAKGENATISQITFYTALTVGLSLLPFFVGMTGLVFLIGVAILDLFLIRFCLNLFRLKQRPQASALFHYSMLYLALLFVALAVDQRWLVGSL